MAKVVSTDVRAEVLLAGVDATESRNGTGSALHSALAVEPEFIDDELNILTMRCLGAGVTTIGAFKVVPDLVEVDWRDRFGFSLVAPSAWPEITVIVFALTTHAARFQDFMLDDVEYNASRSEALTSNLDQVRDGLLRQAIDTLRTWVVNDTRPILAEN